MHYILLLLCCYCSEMLIMHNIKSTTLWPLELSRTLYSREWISGEMWTEKFTVRRHNIQYMYGVTSYNFVCVSIFLQRNHVVVRLCTDTFSPESIRLDPTVRGTPGWVSCHMCTHNYEMVRQTHDKLYQRVRVTIVYVKTTSVGWLVPKLLNTITTITLQCTCPCSGPFTDFVCIQRFYSENALLV